MEQTQKREERGGNRYKTKNKISNLGFVFCGFFWFCDVGISDFEIFFFFLKPRKNSNYLIDGESKKVRLVPMTGFFSVSGVFFLLFLFSPFFSFPAPLGLNKGFNTLVFDSGFGSENR